VVFCLERGADLHTAQLMPLPLTVYCFSKIQIGLPFWYWLTRAVLDKGPLNGSLSLSFRVHIRWHTEVSRVIMVYRGYVSEYIWGGTLRSGVVITVYCGYVSEYISGGTLKSRVIDTSLELPWKLRVKLAKDVACGMVRRYCLT